MNPSATPSIAVHDLRVGMYVHLDLGWMSHPFPLGSFRIADAGQIETIRGLGVASVRWSPDKSMLPPAAADARPPPAGLPPAAEGAEQAARRQRREQLAAQRAATLQCERQYAEAAREWRRTSERVADEPAGARARTEALGRVLMDKLLAQREACIRLLGEAAGDRATAHALNVTVVALLLGRLLGLTPDELSTLASGALLHDIGKIELPDRVRHADDSHTSAEASLYHEHVTHGVTHGRRMALPPAALLVIAQHHEHVDGSGFPQRLAGGRMTLAARIVALVNRYDNLCNPRQPGPALTPHEALSVLYAQGRQRYDATALGSFIRMMGVYPPGSVVQLTDDRWALVMAVNSARPLKPRVLVHDPKVPRDEALYVDLERACTLGIRRSVKPAQLPPAALQYLAPSTRVAYFYDVASAADTGAVASGAR